jgi:hypothetical protein
VRRRVARNSRKKGRKTLIEINIAPNLRSGEIVGAEVRSSDDKFVGEVRNITPEMVETMIVASGGFFPAGKDSIVSR